MFVAQSAAPTVAAPTDVQYISAGAGNRATGSSATLSTSWTHSVAQSGINAVLVVFVGQSSATNATIGQPTVTANGITMDQLTVGNPSVSTGATTSRGKLSFHYLFNPPTGTVTIAVAGVAGTTKSAIAGESALFDNVDPSGVILNPTGTGWSNTTLIATLAANTNIAPFGIVDANWYNVFGGLNGVTISNATSTAGAATTLYIAGSSVTGVGDWFGMSINRPVTAAWQTQFPGTATSPGAGSILLAPA